LSAVVADTSQMLLDQRLFHMVVAGLVLQQVVLVVVVLLSVFQVHQMTVLQWAQAVELLTGATITLMVEMVIQSQEQVEMAAQVDLIMEDLEDHKQLEVR